MYKEFIVKEPFSIRKRYGTPRVFEKGVKVTDADLKPFTSHYIASGNISPLSASAEPEPAPEPVVEPEPEPEPDPVAKIRSSFFK